MASSTNDKNSEYFLSFSEPIPRERLHAVAQKELGETENRKEEELQRLKMLITGAGVASISSTDFLLRFLRYKKFRVQESFEALQNYARLRVSIYERLLKLSPEVVKTCLDLKIIGFLPYRDLEGRLMFFCKPAIWNPDICTLDEIQTVFALLLNYMSETESSQVNGVVLIYDAKNLLFLYVIQMLPYLNFWRKFLIECLPARYHAVHVLYATTPLVQRFLPIVKSLIPKKMRDRLRIHGTNEELCGHICASILPQEFGGNVCGMNTDRLTEVMIEYLQKMKDEQQYFIQ